MKIVPLRAQASAGRPVPEPVRLAQDLVDTGVEMTVPRWIRLFGRRRVRPEEAAGLPGEMCARVPGKAAVPVRSLQDLTELAVFQGLLPASVLPEPALAEALRALERSRWEFETQPGENVGPFGAYQALTEPGSGLTATWNGHRVAL
ncbi:MAG: hypothetical protein AB1758_16350, partial [Candidatus Eremiobacterota bacterium]